MEGVCKRGLGSYIVVRYAKVRVPSVVDHHAKSYVEAQHIEFKDPRLAFVDLAERTRLPRRLCRSLWIDAARAEAFLGPLRLGRRSSSCMGTWRCVWLFVLLSMVEWQSPLGFGLACDFSPTGCGTCPLFLLVWTLGVTKPK